NDHSPSNPSVHGGDGCPGIRQLHQRIPSDPGSTKRKLSLRTRNPRSGTDSRIFSLDVKTSRHDAWGRSQKRDTLALRSHDNSVPRSSYDFRSLSFTAYWK